MSISLRAELVFSTVVELEPVSLEVIELKDFSIAFKAPLSLIDLSVVLRVKRNSLSILVLEVLDISDGINITRFLKGN